jgi:hypothetical protein
MPPADALRGPFLRHKQFPTHLFAHDELLHLARDGRVFCRARPSTMATTPEVATSPPTGIAATTQTMSNGTRAPCGSSRRPRMTAMVIAKIPADTSIEII